MNKLLPLLLLAALTACHSQPSPEQAAIDARVAATSSDSAKAARLDSSRATYYAAGQAAEDSATFYHLQSTHVQATSPGDTAALRRFFANYPAH
jgi:hypothetical protein